MFRTTAVSRVALAEAHAFYWRKLRLWAAARKRPRDDE
jgi:hypothetical protein